LIKITPPHIDDLAELRQLGDNKNLGSYPELKRHYDAFENQYRTYNDNGGNPWQITALPLGDAFKDSLKAHYSDPPKNSLVFIDEFRRKLSPTLCPMCGSYGMGTLDHYLPQANFPEFRFFSKNLVPACGCNSLRNTTVQGLVPPARVIHPYYDDFLNSRLYHVVFTGSYKSPSITIDTVDPHHPEIDILRFHLQEVILNVATLGWFEKSWSDLVRRPHDILDLVLPLPPCMVDGTILKNSIERLRNAKDREHETPNNWDSMLYSGLMNDPGRMDSLAVTINDLR
jgi:hypothetical protein